jgi:hypothetical protein
MNQTKIAIIPLIYCNLYNLCIYFKVLKQEVQDHKPVIDRLNKTGNALVKLCGEQDCLKVQKMLDKDNKKLDNMRNSLRDRSLSIDEALQQSAEV